MLKINIFVTIVLEISLILIHPSITLEEKNSCRLYPSLQEPSKQYLWCQSSEPDKVTSFYGSPSTFGESRIVNDVWSLNTEDDIIVEAIIPGAFKDLREISGIRLDFPLQVVRSGDFSDTPNITLLEMTVSQLDRCAFVGVGLLLERLILRGRNETLFIHQDSLIGLPKLYDLTLADFRRITTTKGETNAEPMCKDILCPLRSLKELHYGRDPYNKACDPLFSIVPESVDLDHEYENRTEVVCNIVRHTCDSNQNLLCWNATSVDTCPNMIKPTSHIGWHWIPWVLAAFMLLLLLILLIIVIYWLRGDAKYGPVATGGAPSVA